MNQLSLGGFMGRRLLISSSMVLLLSGCSATKFSASKNEVLAKNSVFGNESDSTGQIRQPGGGSDSNGTVRQPSLEDLSKQLRQTDTPDETKVSLVCSDSQSKSAPNFKRAVAENLPVQLKIGQTLCTDNKSIIQSLIQKEKILRADLSGICPAALPAAGSALNLTIVINGKLTEGRNGSLDVLYARNRDTSEASEAADSHCDRRASPLVIHRASDVNNPLPIALSSPEEGVDFDLLGARNNHQKVRISWFTNHDYFFLALPNKRGHVTGIDQLFGDNTSGPDGLFADNGYAALAKYDANADGLIDDKDPIFRKLRLWQDLNRDGIGQPIELIPLRRAGIAFIDLDFSTDYAERDQYGNETKMKSVVGYRDGSLDLIFDLWFSYRLGAD